MGNAIATIEQEFSRLWDEQKNKKQLKACLFNLIIYTHESRRAAYFRKVVHSIIEKFPTRIIFIEATKKEEAKEIDVSVSTQICGTEGSLIACDQITIKAPFDELSRVPFIVIPNLVPDLPIYLLWGQDPTSESEILPYLQKFATRLIFDSECTGNLQQFAQQMLSKMDTFNMDFVDMHWTLIKGWRSVLAQTFDTPEKSHMLSISKQITITYNSRPTEFFYHYQTQSLYLQAWLAAQMGWKFVSLEKENEVRTFHYTNGTNPIRITLQPKVHEKHPSGAILGVTFSCANESKFVLSRESMWSKATAHITYQDKCEMPHVFPMPDVEKGLTFMREIFFSKPSEHYRNMLSMIAKTKWESSSC